MRSVLPAPAVRFVVEATVTAPSKVCEPFVVILLILIILSSAHVTERLLARASATIVTLLEELRVTSRAFIVMVSPKLFPELLRLTSLLFPDVISVVFKTVRAVLSRLAALLIISFL